MTVQEHAEKFKAIYGEGEFTLDSNGKATVPEWLMAMLLHLSGVRSKKRRIQKKVLKREVIGLLKRAVESRNN